MIPTAGNAKNSSYLRAIRQQRSNERFPSGHCSYLGLIVDPSPDGSPGFRQEPEWGIYRGSGYGLPGGEGGGWLVTFARDARFGPGYLVAFAVDTR